MRSPSSVGWPWLLLIVGLIGGAPETATADFVFTTIEPPGTRRFSVATGINDAGQIVGDFFDGIGRVPKERLLDRLGPL
jgi:hypothetical protein